jgi:hypothetical protein
MSLEALVCDLSFDAGYSKVNASKTVVLHQTMLPITAIRKLLSASMLIQKV